MHLILVSFCVLLGGGVLSLVSGNRLGRVIGPCACVAGSGMGLIAAIGALAAGGAQSVRHPWAVPGGSFYLHLDALSALFLIPVFALPALGALYGAEYLGRGQQRSHWFFYALLTVGMATTVLAWNGVLFLVAWEVMAIASFFLVVSDHENERAQDAGWTYLVAAHLGAACLFAMFAIMGRTAGSLDFDQFGSLAGLAPGTAAAVFLLAVAGFGAKAGFVPFHVWLPEAHPAAPSHVSAVMSGVMIKTGIYGLVRTLTFLGTPPSWWGVTLVVIGLVCGLFGVLFALAQHDIKRLLAYHSVENIGIITMGVGIGVLGMALGSAPLAALGFAGGLLHVVNHAAFKGLLFLAAGGVIHATGTGEIEHLGGLLKRMPRTGLAFLIAAAAIAGLPPLNGFMSEFLVFVASFHGVGSPAAGVSVAVIAGLALISGLAAACFTKAFGIVFLGEPRSRHTDAAHDPGLLMLAPQAALAAACVLIGLLAPFALRGISPAAGVVLGSMSGEALASLQAASGWLKGVSMAGAALVAIAAALAWLRMRLLAHRVTSEAVTWDCGYAAPTARMQYTASSYAQPLTGMFSQVLRTRRTFVPPQGLFPAPGGFSTATPDVVRESFFAPLFSAVARGVVGLRRVQHGNLHLYVLYIAVTLLALLVWKLG